MVTIHIPDDVFLDYADMAGSPEAAKAAMQQTVADMRPSEEYDVADPDRRLHYSAPKWLFRDLLTAGEIVLDDGAPESMFERSLEESVSSLESLLKAADRRPQGNPIIGCSDGIRIVTPDGRVIRPVLTEPETEHNLIPWVIDPDGEYQIVGRETDEHYAELRFETDPEAAESIQAVRERLLEYGFSPDGVAAGMEREG